MKSQIIPSVLLCVALAACTTTDPIAERAVDVIPAGLAQHCEPKGNVSSEAPYYGVFTKTTQEKLVSLAKESALRLGANALVLGEPVESDHKYTMTGQAYHCAK